MLDFPRKWYVFGWAVRNLTRNIPSVCMAGDHDMFHGNIWDCEPGTYSVLAYDPDGDYYKYWNHIQARRKD